MSIRNSLLDLKIESLDRVIDNADSLFVDFQKFRKLLAECSILDGSDINQVVQDAKDIIKGGESFSNFLNDPNRVVCFATAITGLNTFVQDQIKKLNIDLKSYYKGLLPKMNDLLRGLSIEYGPERLSGEFMAQLDSRMADMMDIGAGFIGKQLDSLKIDEKAIGAAARLGKFFGFLMTFSPELRYVVLIIFIKNIQDQTLKRIQQIISLKKSINSLVYDIDKINDNISKSGIDLSVSFEAYKNALTILENSIPFSQQQEFSILQKNFYDPFISTSLNSNFESAKGLLKNQRNKFLENILKSPIVDYDISAKYLYLIAEDYSHYRLLDIIHTNSTTSKPNDNYLAGLNSVDSVFISHIYNTKNTELVSFEKKENEFFWFKFISPNKFLPTGSGIVKIGKYFFKILKTDVKIINATQKYNQTEHQILLLELLKPSYYSANDIAEIESIQNKLLELFIELPFSFENRPNKFTITDQTYTIQDYKTDIKNTIILKNDAQSIIKSVWAEQKTFNFVWFLNYNESFKIVRINGNYPNIVEKEPLPRDIAFNELPQPYKDLYNQFLNLKDKELNVGDVFKTTGGISNFLFGRDIVNGPIDKLGNYFSSYEEFMKSGGNVLNSLCGLKQSLYGFYMLYDNLENLDAKQSTLAFETNKEILINLQRVITDTLTAMTARGETTEYLSLEEIKNSPLYSKLIPYLVSDFTNITNLQGILKSIEGFGNSFNANVVLNNEFKKIQELISYIQTQKKHIETLNLEESLWNTLSTAFIDSIELMTQGERVSNIKPMIDEVYTKLDTLLISLNDIYNRLLFIDTTGATTVKARKNLESIFEEISMDHWVNYLREGNFEKFVNQDFSSWVGKYGPTIKCLSSISSKLGGYDKLILNKVLTYLKYVDISEIITNFHIGDLELGHSVNLNAFRQVSSSTQNSLKESINRIAIVKSSINRLHKLKEQ